MVRRGGYQTSAQKAGKSAGQRKRRQARDRKRKMREANLYQISVRSNVLSDVPRRDKSDLAVYGVYKDGSEWVLTAMAIRRSEERLVSDRQGATESKVMDELVVVPRGGELSPRDGFEVERFDSKKAALQSISAERSTRIDTGEYVVRSSDWNRSMNLHKVDRDDYREWSRSSSVRSVK